jgi:hypothetical protein
MKKSNTFSSRRKKTGYAVTVFQHNRDGPYTGLIDHFTPYTIQNNLFH